MPARIYRPAYPQPRCWRLGVTCNTGGTKRPIWLAREPQRAVRPRRDAPKELGAIARGDREFANDTGGHDAADLVGVPFDEATRKARLLRSQIHMQPISSRPPRIDFA
jgi:hypothetical protein